MNGQPSSCHRRAKAASLALAGFAVAAYLGGYQMGCWGTVWEPVFGAGSARVLHSAVSRLLPVPDAFVGAAAYLLEFVLELLGDETRWRSAPGVTAVNMLVVVAMAVGSAGLVAAQGLVFHAWCTLCLGSAACSFAVFALSWPEIAALAASFSRGRA